MTITATEPQINPKGVETFAVQASNVRKYDMLLYNDRVCTVVSSEKYENQYSSRVPKRLIVLSTLREGKILETVMQSDNIMTRITANGMAMMPEELPKEPVLAGQAKKHMVIMIKERVCRIRNVTLNKIGETTLICIQAQTLDETRCEDIRLPADVPLEFPGQKNAIAAVQKAVSENEGKFLTRLEDGSICCQRPPKTPSADIPLKEEKVKVELKDPAVVVSNITRSTSSTMANSTSSIAASSTSSVATDVSYRPRESREYEKTRSGPGNSGECCDSHQYVRQWALELPAPVMGGRLVLRGGQRYI